jgi:hypothetical protein
VSFYRSGKAEECQGIGQNQTTNLGVRSSNLFGRAITLVSCCERFLFLECHCHLGDLKESLLGPSKEQKAWDRCTTISILGKRPQKITLAEMRSMRLRGLLIYCGDYRCGHSVEVGGDRWPDDVRLSDLEPLFTCTVWSNGLVGSITTLAIVLLFWPVIDKALCRHRPAVAAGQGGGLTNRYVKSVI